MDRRKSDLFPLNISRIARACMPEEISEDFEIPWEHRDFNRKIL